MTESWYILKDDQHKGPFSVQQLKELLNSGQLKPTDQVNKGPGTRPRAAARLPASKTPDQTSANNRRPPRPDGRASTSNGLFAWLRSERIGRFAWPSVFIGFVVMATSVAWLAKQWSHTETIAATILRGHADWDSGDRAKAIDTYRLTLAVLPPSESASLVVQRVVESEIENGHEQQAKRTLDAALDRAIVVSLDSLDGRRLLAEVTADRATAKSDTVLVADGDREPLFPQLIDRPLSPLPGSNRELAVANSGGQRFVFDENARAVWISADRKTAFSLQTGENPAQGKQAGSVVPWNVDTGQSLGRQSVSWDGEFLGVSPSGKWLVSQQPSNRVAITFLQNGKQLTTVEGDRIKLIEFSADESRVAIGDGSSIRIHETNSGEKTVTFSGVDSNVLAFSSDGTLAAYSAREANQTGSAIKVVDVEQNVVKATLPSIRGRGPTALAFIPDRNDRLLVGGSFYDGNVRLFDLLSRQVLSTFKAHGNDENASQISIDRIQWHPSGESILSNSSRGRVCWWELKGQRLLASYQEVGNVQHAISRDGATFLAGNGRLDLPELSPPETDRQQLMPRIGDNEVLICNSPAFQIESSIQEKFGFSQDGRLLVAPAKPKNLRIIEPRFFDVLTGQRLAPMSYESDMRLFAAIKSSRVLPWRPAINSADWFGLCRFRSFVLDDPERANLIRDLCGSPASLQKNTFSADGNVIAIGGTKSLSFRSTKTGEEIVKLQARDYSNYRDFMECIISPDNKSVAMVWYQDGAVWDLKTGRRFLQPFKKTGTFLEYSQDGKYLATIGDDGRLRFWSTSDWTEAANFEPPKVRQEWAGFNPSATHFATIMHASTGREVKIWNIATKQIETTIDARNVVSVRFIHDDRLWLWENAQRRLQDRVALYSISGTELARIPIGQGPEVTKVRFSPSGRHVATFIENATISVWDVFDSR
jgi:WD40 repeat protein